MRHSSLPPNNMIPWMVFKLVADDDLNIHFIQDIMAGKFIYIIALLWYETKYCLHLSIILISQYNINVVCNFLNLPTCSDKYPLLFLQYCHSLYTEAFGQRYYDFYFLSKSPSIHVVLPRDFKTS